MNTSQRTLTAIIAAIIITVGAVAAVTIASTPEQPTQVSTQAAHTQAQPKDTVETLDDLNAAELERDYLKGEICWLTVVIAQEYRQIREHKRLGSMGSPWERDTFASIRLRIYELRAAEVKLADLDRRINATRDAIHKER